jgi:hypothetical protein
VVRDNQHVVIVLATAGDLDRLAHLLESHRLTLEYDASAVRGQRLLVDVADVVVRGAMDRKFTRPRSRQDEAAVVPGRYELPPVSGVSYVAFCDPSGGSSDSFTLSIAHGDKNGRGILDVIRERRPPFRLPQWRPQ